MKTVAFKGMIFLRQVQTSTSSYLFTPITKSWQISNEFLYKHDLKKERKKWASKMGLKKNHIHIGFKYILKEHYD